MTGAFPRAFLETFVAELCPPPFAPLKSGVVWFVWCSGCSGPVSLSCQSVISCLGRLCLFLSRLHKLLPLPLRRPLAQKKDGTKN